jgi:VanZ family protein
MNQLEQSFVRTHLPVLLWAAAIFVSSSIPGVRLPETRLLRLDTLLHFLVYFCLAWLINRSLRGQRRFPLLARRHLPATILLTVVYGMTDEVHQLFVPGRSAAWSDLAADAAGGVLFAGLERLREWFRNRRRASD